ncbi:Flagellar basal body-associated protein FliL [Hyphomicrobium sp. GJ21]|jgi:flagellar FliL protein|uniref:flagellar basal body-associated FliL family protein n=1 Tax=Hyphomicrobium sp. GJ21 TaxID=113574 RepID=UPI000622B7CE|nr:flagellar basal body-associated FliL family protein [Hyphomicrobium sp. GJ21]MBN9353916.1 flagellar basal body-associated FliL family protein [Hyphomicrobium denitrificans]CEJ87369.1 Flagellar basal body-associated protein FliL [Hyphomicrobium sp. GJ21]
MAQALIPSNGPAPSAAPSTADLVKSMIAAVILGVAGGGAFGYFAVPVGPAPAPVEEAKPASVAPEAPSAGRFPSDALEISIPSIIVDLSGEPKARVRLDVSIVAVHGTSDGSVLKNEVREDIIAYLKGLTVADIQGVRGLQNLREQLEDRAKIRGRGAILGLLIGGFVIE